MPNFGPTLQKKKSTPQKALKKETYFEKKRKTDWLSTEDHKYVYSRTPRLCIDVVVTDLDGGATLIVKRAIAPYKEKWSFPGGRLFYKESIAHAIARILKAELGIQSTKRAPRFIGEPMEFLRDGTFLHSISNVFTVVIDDEEKAQIKLDKQGKRFRFVHATPRNMHPVHRKFAITHRILGAF